MTVVDTLTVNISAATQAFEKGMKSARSSLTGFTSGLKKAAVGVAALAAAGTATAIAMTKDFAKLGDELDKLSTRVNISVETLSGLKFAAEQSGTNIDSLGQALFRMQRRVANASTETGPAVRALKELRLEAARLTERTAEEQFFDIVNALNEMENEARAGQLAFEIFGDNARQLVPLLEAGEEGIRGLIDEARELGVVLSEEDRVAAREFTDAMNRLNSAFRAVSLNIGAELAPAFTNIANLLSRNVKPAMENLRPIAVDVFGTMASLAATTVEAIGRVAEEFIKVRIGLLEFFKFIGPLQITKPSGVKVDLETVGPILQEELNRAIGEQNTLLKETEQFTKRIADNIRDASEGFRESFVTPRPERFPFEDFPIAGESLEEQAAKSLGGVFDFFRSIGGLRKAVTLPNIPSAITPPRVQVAQATLAGSREAIEARIRHQLRRESPEKTEEQMLIQLKELVKLARERGGAVIEEIGGFVT